LRSRAELTESWSPRVGLRYDLMMPYSMAQGNNVFLNAAAGKPSAGNLPGAETEYGNGQGCAGFNHVAFHKLYFAPRLGFAYPVEDLSAKKLFRFVEGTLLTLRVDYFNALNRVQAPFPTETVASPNFGQVTSKFTAVNREGQLEATFNF
jgi:hypothetical protein